MILTVDLGTSVTKVVLWGEHGPVSVGRSTLECAYGSGNRAEQDPDSWWRSLVAACAACAGTSKAAADALRSVTVVGFAAARQTFVPVAADGTTLGPALLWSDRRSDTEAAALARSLDDSGVAPRRLTGMVLDAGSVASKIAWIERHEPERLRQARWLLTPRDLLIWRLTGTVASDSTMASASGLYELGGAGELGGPGKLDGRDDRGTSLRLAAAIVERLPAGVADMLPVPGDSDAAVGALLGTPAAELGLPPGIPVVVGAGDRACEVLGTGASPRRPMVSWGTTANVSVPVDALVDTVSDALVVTRGARQGFLLEGGLAAAGALADWLARLTGIDTDTLAHHARSSPPGANGVVVLPWFGGARAPWWRAQARGAVVGLALDHHLGDVARAVVEAVAWDVQRCMEEVADTSGFDGLALGGGGATVALWTEILTGVTGLPAERRRSGEAASAGAALLAARAVGSQLDLDDLDPVADEIVPDPDVVAGYRGRRALADAAATALIALEFPLDTGTADTAGAPS